MTQKVRISYSHPGLQPPVYFAGSLGDRQWVPLEMDVDEKDDGELEFWREFHVEEGEYQYKFRLGPGDWWVLDETKQIADDGAGNRNNLIIVKPVEKATVQKASEIDTHVMDQATAPVQAPEKSEAKEAKSSIPVPAFVQIPVKEEKKEAKAQEHVEKRDPPVEVKKQERKEAVETHVQEDVTAPIQEPEHSTKNLDASADVPPSDHTLAKQGTSLLMEEEPKDDYSDGEAEPERALSFAHEIAQRIFDHPAKGVPSEQDEEEESRQQDDEQEPEPLFRHETAVKQSPTLVQENDEDEDEDEEDEDQEEMIRSPLFKHETFAPELDSEEGAPLFRHETVSQHDEAEPYPSSRSDRSNSTTSHSSHRSHHSRHADPEDVNDPSLERFPTDEAGIMAHLQRAETRMREDQTAVDDTPLSPTLTTRGLSSAAPPPVMLVTEIGDMSNGSVKSLDAINEVEEERSPSPDGHEEDAKIADLIEPTAEDSTEQPEMTPKPSFSSHNEPVSRDPPTPPMTPIDEKKLSAGAHDGTTESSDEARIDLSTPRKPRTRMDNSTDHITSRSATSSEKTQSISATMKQAASPLTNIWGWFAGLCGGGARATGVAVAVGVAATLYAVGGRNQ